jgi:hypothetical protein
MHSGSAHEIRGADPSSNVLVEVPVPRDPTAPRKRKFVCDAANLLVYYSHRDGETIVGMELCLAGVRRGRESVDLFISSDDYYKKFVVMPAERTVGGLVRGRASGYMSVDKSEVLERARTCTADLEQPITDFVMSRIRKYLY